MIFVSYLGAGLLLIVAMSCLLLGEYFSQSSCRCSALHIARKASHKRLE